MIIETRDVPRQETGQHLEPELYLLPIVASLHVGDDRFEHALHYDKGLYIRSINM